MANFIVPKDSTSATSLAAITAGAVGAVLLIMSISSIAAIISMGAITNNGMPGTTNQTDSAVAHSENISVDASESVGVQEEFLDDHVGHFFDALYREDFMSAAKEAS